MNRVEALLSRDMAAASRRMIRLRWVAGAALLLATAIGVRLLHLPLPEKPLYLLGALVLVYNAVLLSWGGREISPRPERLLRQTRWVVVIQVALDWTSMAVFLHLTGGITSPGIPFFLIHMLMVTILLPEVPWYIYVSTATGMLVALAVLESQGILSNHPALSVIPTSLHRDPYFVLAQVLFFVTAATATVLLTASIMKRLRERERQVTALLHSSQAVSSTLSLGDVLLRLAENAAQAVLTDRASVRLLDETGETLDLVASFGLRAEYLSKGPVELSRSGLDREVLSGGAVIVDQAANDERIQYPREVTEEGIRSILAVPVMGRTGPKGVLRVYSTQAQRFTRDDAELVVAIAGEGAVAIENAMAHQAVQKADQDRAQFVRTVTHELRSPVSGAQSLARVLLEGTSEGLTERQRDVIQRISARLDRLMDLINDLLALAAAQAPGFQPPPQPVGLLEMVRWALDQHAAAASEKRVALQPEIPGGEILVRATRDGLAQVLGNLIDNAVKYTPSGGRVRVTARAEGNAAVLQVADTGLGIPEADLPHLWEEFFRAGNVRKAGIVGTGLGLSIVKRLVESYGGRIGAQSAEGTGTVFTVTLPLASESGLS
ncbi:MAG: HAMP domain-containing sensor histidine kinase [Anaerolineales bacterium]|jgi:signal transduction histidine kinase